MNFLCYVFGHKPPVYAKKGWYSPGEQYGVLTNFYTDGVGRVHSSVTADCARCHKKFVVARVHLPANEQRDEVTG